MTTATISAALEARIKAVLDEKSMLKHPFYTEWTTGELPLSKLREYARQYYHFEAGFPRYLSSIHARTESPEIRQLLLDNLWDEEHGERNHPVLWLEFAAALDVPANDVKNATLRPETKALIDHFNATSREAPLAEALATLFAYEGQVPAIAWQKIKGLTEHYNFEPRQFEFFSVHLVADIAHAGAEMQSIAMATVDEDGVLGAVNTACDRLLAFLDGCYETAAA
ncbi:MAG: CADD family putative folate metabolism protein [Dehalococcoidia bacterium]|nr:CADD family putative folate metabolism protein [Dehalococcoidia bacterium]